jgi:pantoate--beta-alanine ligase
MQTIDSAAAMQAWADEARCSGQRIGFVPTMGYLHEGHLSLVREARRCARRSVASIFVNPLQFAAGEDLDRYPRALERDRALLAEAGVDALYLPNAGAMYPPGFQTEVCVTELTRGLCGRSRPGHFRGVTTVVVKLLHAVKPHVAVFGEKDFQQLVAVRRMVTDLDLDVEIVGVPIVREPDGLAMSSRNAYLSPREREAALCLHRALEAASAAFAAGERDAGRILARARAILAAEPLAEVDYVEIADAETLAEVPVLARPALLALAVRIGHTRLIDNVVLGRPQADAQRSDLSEARVAHGGEIADGRPQADAQRSDLSEAKGAHGGRI